MRILLTEDNLSNQKLVKMMLRKVGYQVEVANNGIEGVQKYTASPNNFNLILMDIQMPGMDGIEATKTIRQWESANSGRIPIIAMTANVMQEDKEKCFEIGMDDYIPKPIKKELVFKILNKWVNNKESII